jgi:UPF0271 protein
MASCDLNCDMGEGIGYDAGLMPFISSANIACGYHAGNEDIMKETILLCLKHNVTIGAHPSYPDKENFGRKELNLLIGEVYQIVRSQIQLLKQIAALKGARLHHVKPHGALYNYAARHKETAKAIANAILDVDPRLIVYGLSNSYLISEAQAIGLKVANEVFADRTYQDDGTLTPRKNKDALIENVEDSIKQVMQMVTEGTVRSISGNNISIKADTICVHGDGKNAVSFASKIYNTLQNHHIEVKPV